MKVYIAFSVKDNQNTADEYWVNSSTNSYELFNGYSDTRGLRLQNISLLVTGLGNSAGPIQSQIKDWVIFLQAT
jgi:hypothetical protein